MLMHNLLVSVGHSIGGMHPFYDEEIVKVEQTGGIMDYGLQEMRTVTAGHNHSYNSCILATYRQRRVV